MNKPLNNFENSIPNAQKTEESFYLNRIALETFPEIGEKIKKTLVEAGFEMPPFEKNVIERRSFDLKVIRMISEGKGIPIENAFDEIEKAVKKIVCSN
jgi:hypothetical protein